MAIITAKQASELLNVSEATIRNWVRHGYLISAEDTKSRFRDNDIIALKEKIERGEIDRLRKRANKRSSDNSFIPDEYLDDTAFVNETEKIIKIFKINRLDLELSLFTLIMRQLVLSGEFSLNNQSDIFRISSCSKWKRECVKNELLSWADELQIDESLYNQWYKSLYDSLTMITHDDTIGIIYQSLLSEGSKSRHGAYYTPKIMVEKIFNEYCSKNSKFLDPCCGTGEFLICAARSGYYDPESLYGYDIDALAVKIARFNLLLTFREKEFSPNIYKADTLTEIASGAMFCETNDLKNTFDLIATNPPWGSAVKDCNLCKKMYPQITSRESFSLFLSKAMILAKRRGYISFILPESVLNIKAHSDIRKHLLENTTIKAVHALGRRFKGVFTPVIRLDLINEKAFDGSTLDVVRENGNSYKIPQSRFKDNDNFIFDVSVSNEEHKILSFIYEKPYVTLKDNAEWAMGIVTGDNRKFITDKQSSGSEPVYKGSDVNKFFLKSPKSYIKYEPELFQQTAPEYIYRAGEKLIYKFISDRLIFAYDRNKSLTLNSANILIPKLDGYPIKLVLGLLNSGIYQFIFSRKFNTHKVLKGDLEKLPLPLIKNEDQNQIISLVEEAINGKDVCRELDSAIMRIIGLSQDQMAVIRDMS